MSAMQAWCTATSSRVASQRSLPWRRTSPMASQVSSHHPITAIHAVTMSRADLLPGREAPAVPGDSPAESGLQHLQGFGERALVRAGGLGAQLVRDDEVLSADRYRRAAVGLRPHHSPG